MMGRAGAPSMPETRSRDASCRPTFNASKHRARVPAAMPWVRRVHHRLETKVRSFFYRVTNRSLLDARFFTLGARGSRLHARCRDAAWIVGERPRTWPHFILQAEHIADDGVAVLLRDPFLEL